MNVIYIRCIKPGGAKGQKKEKHETTFSPTKRRLSENSSAARSRDEERERERERETRGAETGRERPGTLSTPGAQSRGCGEAAAEERKQNKREGAGAEGGGKPASESQLDDPFRNIEINLLATTGTKLSVFGNEQIQIPCVGISDVLARVVTHKIKRTLKNI